MAFLVQSVFFSQTPPSPPPGSYVRISIEKTAEQFQRNADTCLLKVTLRETFNVPSVRTIRFGFLGPDSGSTVRPLRLIEDRNGNGREDGADTLICAAAAQAGDSFSFDAMDAGLSAETVWLVCGGFSISGNPLAKVRVEFKPDAFGGLDTFFDFPGFDSGEILVNVEERNPRAEAPETFRLLQNFPNPFNPRTHFRLALPKQGRVRFSVFNRSCAKSPIKTECKEKK